MPTAPTAKAYDITQIHQGPGDLWIIGNPPSDTAQRLTLDTASGTPDTTAHPGSICLGMTTGGITTTLKVKPSDIMVDQAETAVDSFTDTLEATIEAELTQQGVALLQNALTTGVFSTVASPGYNQLTYGGLNVIPTACIAAISPKRTGTNLWLVSLLYKCSSKGGMTVMMDRTKKSTHKVQFSGQSDLTRTAGRQVGVQYETL
jgi:hypothetical protein